MCAISRGLKKSYNLSIEISFSLTREPYTPSELQQNMCASTARSNIMLPIVLELTHDSAFRFCLAFEGALRSSQNFDRTAARMLTNRTHVRLRFPLAFHGQMESQQSYSTTPEQLH